MRMKRVFTALLALCMILSVLSGSVWAAGVVASGTCGADGDNLTWTLDSYGVLTIEGTGRMANYWSEMEQDPSPWYAYRDQIKELKIGSGVTSIGEDAFSSHNNLLSVTIPGNVKKIGDYAFCECDGLRRVELEYGVEEIGGNVFSFCNSLTEIVLPDSVTEIYDAAFDDDRSLTNIVLPKELKVIHTVSFLYCENLTCITIPANVTDIKASAFDGCDNLQHVLYAGTEEQWAKISVDEGNEALANVTVHFNANGDEIVVGRGDTYTTLYCAICDETVYVPDADCWEYAISGDGVTITDYDGESSDVVIPEQFWGFPVIEIGEFALSSDPFDEWDSLTSVVIPETVTSIGMQAFGLNVDLTSVVIPGSVESMGDAAFWGCENLSSVTISDGVTSIGQNAFMACFSLASVNIPASVTNIDYGAFMACIGLTDIHFNGDAPAIGEVAFDGVVATAYYPAGNATWTTDVMQDYGGTITWVTSADYVFTEGAGSTWIKNSGETLTFRSVAAMEELENVLVDGAPVAEESYTVKSGSTIVTLTAEYLQTLETGKHSLTISFTNGAATVPFTVADEAEPEDPTQSQEPGQTEQPGETEKPGDTEKPSQTEKPEVEEIPKTGDTDIIVLVLALIGILAVSVVFTEKKKLF